MTTGANEVRARRLSRELRGGERFRLALEMAARGRWAETEEMIFEASRVPCSHLDPQMGEAFADLRSLMREFDASSRRLFGSLLAIEVIRDLWSGVAEAASGERSVFIVPPLADGLEQLAEAVEAKLGALKQAFEDLCGERLGVEADTLWAVQPAWVMSGFLERRDRIGATTPGEEELAEARAGLLAGWGPEGLGAVLQPGEMG